jgi:hypothetical protein
MRPGVDIISSELPPPRSAPTDTSVWFVVGETGIGPVVPTLVRSMGEYESTYGERDDGLALYDAADAFFREGGAKLYVSAIPTTPSVALAESEVELDSLTRAELDAIAEQNALVPADYSTKADLIEAIEASNGQIAAPQAATPSDFTDALDKFTRQLGPGQVSIPGQSDTATNTALLEHAEACNRIALLETPDSSDPAQLITAVDPLRDLAQARYGAMWAPHAVIPGVAAGTTRTVPYTAIEAALMAELDRAFNPNIPAAGVNGQSSYATDLTQRYTDQQYHDLNEGGVDMARLIYEGVRSYGYRTLVDPVDPTWLDLGNARLNMAIVAQAEGIAERFVFSQLDGRGRTIAQFGAELRAMLIPFYEADALYGATADEAFQVDVGNQVNTPETIANGELHAVIKLRMSPFAEWVVIEIVKVATTQALAA